MTDKYELFKDKVWKKTGINLSLYKERQMKRRIESLASRNALPDLLEYFSYLEKNPNALNEFINYLTINVSEFFRNYSQWQVFEKELVLPKLQQKGSIKIWSAACSTGEEPYTVAMILSRHMPLAKISIIATDIDLGAIDKAKRGTYTKASLRNVPADCLEKYFTPEGENIFSISPMIKRCVNFRQQNLLKDRFTSGFDIIICRNVMIYFTDPAKEEIYRKFSQALAPEGVLFVGSTEQIIAPSQYQLKPLKTFFYQKISS